MLILVQRKRRGCSCTLAERNKTSQLELPRAWKLLDNSKPSQVSEGSSSHNLFLNGDKIKKVLQIMVESCLF